MITLKDLADIDFAASLGGLVWAVLALEGVEAFARLASPEIAFAAAGVAFTRWAARIRKRRGET